MNPVLAIAEAYAEKFTSPEDALSQAVHQQTLSHPKQHMISGRVQGKFLEFLSRLMKPRRVLEIGTFTGYSALALAKGLAEDGIVHTIEIRPEEADIAEQNFNLLNAKDKIILHRGDAREILAGLTETWDLVFIDADKTGYVEYYKMIFPALRQGGLIVADNVLFHGEVLEPVLKGKNAKAIQSFNEYVQQDPASEQVLLTVRDGLMLILKK